MDQQVLAALASYNAYANHLVLDRVAEIGEDQFHFFGEQEPR
jgi:hypothetical protein